MKEKYGLGEERRKDKSYYSSLFLRRVFARVVETAIGVDVRCWGSANKYMKIGGKILS
jgi:hypothetical protein